MTSLYDVLFEVSNEARLCILEVLNEGDEFISKISNEMELSLTETSRHFNRLSGVGLIAKRVSGAYGITPLGKLVLRQISPMGFCFRHVDYFKFRDLGWLPKRFVNRLDELGSADVNYSNKANIMITSRTMTRVFNDAEERIDYLLDEELMRLILYRKPEENAIDKYMEKVSQGVKIRFLFPGSLDMSRVHPDMDEMNRVLTRSGNWESRVIKDGGVFIHMSEKEIAVLSFADHGGAFDYLGFEGRDPVALSWCVDVFSYYWDRSQMRDIY